MREVLLSRSKQLAIETYYFLQKQRNNTEFDIVKRQLFRSVTSVAANYRAVLRSRSNKEFYSKLCIVVEEADESMFWMEFLEEIGFSQNPELNNLKKECFELLKVFGKTKSTLKKSL